MTETTQSSVSVPRSWMTGGVVLVVLSVIVPRWAFVHLGALPSFTVYTLPISLFVLGLPALWLIWPPLRARMAYVASGGAAATAVFFAWYAWRFLTSAIGDLPAVSIQRVYNDLFYIGGLFFVGLVIGGRADAPSRVFRALMWATIVVCVIGAIEKAAGKNLVNLLGLRLERAENAAAWLQVMGNRMRNGIYRAQSVFSHPLLFGQFVAAMIPISLYQIANAETRFRKVTAIAALALIGPSVLFTGSRGAILAALLAGGSYFFFVFARRNIRSFLGMLQLAGVAVAAVTLVFLSSTAISQLVAGRDTEEVRSSLARSVMFSRSLDAVGLSPVLGFGDGMGALKTGLIGTEGLPTIDCLYLSVPVDAGLVGLGLLLLFCGLVVWAGLRVIMSRRSDEGDAAAALTAMVISMLYNQIIHSSFELFGLVYLAAALLFAMAVRCKPVRAPRVFGRAPGPGYGRVPIGG